MNFVNEYALLIAVALPVLAIVGVQVFLFVAGERDTLLIPRLTRYPSIDYGRTRAPVANVTPSSSGAASVESSNDEIERQAA